MQLIIIQYILRCCWCYALEGLPHTTSLAGGYDLSFVSNEPCGLICRLTHDAAIFLKTHAAGDTAPNVSIITFECKSRAMRYFEGKIFPLGGEEKALISMLFREGISTYTLVDPKNPLLQQMQRLEDAPFGSSQMTKKLLEIFLIRLHRKEGAFAKKSRYHYKVNGIDIPFPVKELLDLLQKNV